MLQQHQAQRQHPVQCAMQGKDHELGQKDAALLSARKELETVRAHGTIAFQATSCILCRASHGAWPSSVVEQQPC